MALLARRATADSLVAGFAQRRHGGDVTGLGDLLEQQRRIEHRQAKAAIFLRHRHAEHAEPGELLHVVPREGAVHVFLRVGLEFSLRQVAHRGYHAPLLSGELKIHCLSSTQRRSWPPK